MLKSAAIKQIELYDAAAGTLVRATPAGSSNSIHFASDGSGIAITDGEWDWRESFRMSWRPGGKQFASGRSRGRVALVASDSRAIVGGSAEKWGWRLSAFPGRHKATNL